MMKAAFAIPGDKDQRTGGYLYNATVLRLLNAFGCETAHIRLPDSFPDPSPEDMDKAIATLAAITGDRPVIVDGLAFGALDPTRLGAISAPIIAMVHHPLGLETGLSRARAEALLTNETAALAEASHVVVPSAHIAETLTSRLGVEADRITIAHPGFARSDMILDRKPLTPPLILSVGLLTGRKGHDVLLDALKRLTDLPWQARIIGRAHARQVADALKARARDNGLADRVSFAGEVDPDALQTSYQEASFFALATRYEGYGIVFGEAMMHGLPIVSCAVGAVPETVGEAGLLVPSDDPDAFAEALRSLLQQPDKAALMKDKALAAARHLNSWEDTTRHFLDVLGRVTR